jgi:type IV pilus assembly protein PilF
MIRLQENNFIFALLLFFLLGCSSTPSGQLKQKTTTQKKAELYYDYGTNALVAKDYTKALKNLKLAVETVDDDSRYHNNLGMAYFFKGDIDLAIRHLKRSIDLDDKNSDAQNNLASIYFEKGKFDQAEKLYREVLENLEYSKQFRVYYNLGLIADKMNKSQQATEFYKKAAENNKGYCPAQYQLGIKSSQNHNYHQASIYFQNAYLGSCPDNPAPYFQEAMAFVNLGEDKKALLRFKDLIEKFPSSKEAILSQRKMKTLSINSFRKNERIISESKSRRKNNEKATNKKTNNQNKPVKALKF